MEILLTWITEHTDLLSILLSVIALIVSIIALLLPFYRMRLHLAVSDARLVTLGSADVVLDLIVINRSSDPVAITGAFLSIKDSKMTADRLSKPLAQRENRLNGRIVSHGVVKSSALPQTLTPFESRRLILRFPCPSEEAALRLSHQGSEEYPTADDAPVSAHLRFETSKGRCGLKASVRIAYPPAWSIHALDEL